MNCGHEKLCVIVITLTEMLTEMCAGVLWFLAPQNLIQPGVFFIWSVNKFVKRLVEQPNNKETQAKKYSAKPEEMSAYEQAVLNVDQVIRNTVYSTLLHLQETLCLSKHME